MAKFRGGDKVRLIARHMPDVHPAWEKVPIGAEGVVIDGPHSHPDFPMPFYVVRFPGYDSGYRDIPDWYAAYANAPSELAPATDPKAEQFLESIRKLKPYEEPKVPAREDIASW